MLYLSITLCKYFTKYFGMSGSRKNTCKRLQCVERKLAMMQPELKHHRTSINDNVIAGTTSVWILNNMAQGDAVDERVGDRAKIKKIEFSVLVAGNNMDVYCISPTDANNVPQGGDLPTYSAGTFQPDEFKTYRQYLTRPEQ